MRIYCYVTYEACRITATAKPGTEAWDGRKISRHGDYFPWVYGKRATLKRCAMQGYMGRAARAVCKEMGWVGSAKGEQK